MPRGIEGNEIASSKKATPKASSQPSAQKGQKTLLGFFQRTPGPAPVKKEISFESSPLPSSPALRSSPLPVASSTKSDKENGLIIPVPSTYTSSADRPGVDVEVAPSSPIRKVSTCEAAPPMSVLTQGLQGRKRINYMISDEEDEDTLRPTTNGAKRRKVVMDDSDNDEFGLDDATQAALLKAGKIRPSSIFLPG